MISKVKYNRGHLVDGKWVFGAVDPDTKELRLELCPENKRNREILRNLMNNHIEPGAEIITDCWRGYGFLDDPTNGFSHKSVNHSIEFVRIDENGKKIHTNNIESEWRPIKDFFRKRNLTPIYFRNHLKVFCFLIVLIDINVSLFFWRNMNGNGESRKKKSSFKEFLKLCAAQYRPTILDHLESDLAIDLSE